MRVELNPTDSVPERYNYRLTGPVDGGGGGGNRRRTLVASHSIALFNVPARIKTTESKHQASPTGFHQRSGRGYCPCIKAGLFLVISLIPQVPDVPVPLQTPATDEGNLQKNGPKLSPSPHNDKNTIIFFCFAGKPQESTPANVKYTRPVRFDYLLFFFALRRTLVLKAETAKLKEFPHHVSYPEAYTLFKNRFHLLLILLSSLDFCLRFVDGCRI